MAKKINWQAKYEAETGEPVFEQPAYVSTCVPTEGGKVFTSDYVAWLEERLSTAGADILANFKRTEKVIQLGFRYGGIDGGHHKQWVIDQMIRKLTGCPMVKKSAADCNGSVYTYRTQGESKEYKRLVKEHKAGEDGPETYEWDEGVAP